MSEEQQDQIPESHTEEVHVMVVVDCPVCVGNRSPLQVSICQMCKGSGKVHGAARFRDLLRMCGIEPGEPIPNVEPDSDGGSVGPVCGPNKPTGLVQARLVGEPIEPQ